MKLNRSKWLRKKTLSGLVLGLFSLGLIASGSAWAKDAKMLQLGVPTWPGVTVQSEVAAQLLNVMGFKTKQTNASPAFILNSISSGRLDIYLGGWMPTEAGLINPLADKGDVKIMTTNISNALMGIAVPKYAWEAGVKTIDDLHKYPEKFGKTIYGIEPGSGFNMAIKDAIKNNEHDLGDWQMTPSSTSAMLVQVDRALKKDKWIAFLGWEPHWMNIKYDIKYLKPVGEPKIAGTSSDVLTVANPDMVENYPQVGKFLTQFQISKDTMSTWILKYGYDQIEPKEVATTWITANLDKVAKWLDGVKTLDGDSAIDAVRARYSS